MVEVMSSFILRRPRSFYTIFMYIHKFLIVFYEVVMTFWKAPIKESHIVAPLYFTLRSTSPTHTPWFKIFAPWLHKAQRYYRSMISNLLKGHSSSSSSRDCSLAPYCKVGWRFKQIQHDPQCLYSTNIKRSGSTSSPLRTCCWVLYQLPMCPSQSRLTWPPRMWGGGTG